MFVAAQPERRAATTRSAAHRNTCGPHFVSRPSKNFARGDGDVIGMIDNSWLRARSISGLSLLVERTVNKKRREPGNGTTSEYSARATLNTRKTRTPIGSIVSTNLVEKAATLKGRPTMNTRSLFISHISEERDIAALLK